MTISQVSQAMEIARSEADLTLVDDTPLYGCSLPGFRSVCVTLACVAKFLRWHCILLNGAVDETALNDLRFALRHRIEVV